MQKIEICDACDIDRASMREYCFEFSRKHNLESEIQEFTSGESLLEADFPDVLLLEINLGRVDGLLVKQVYEKQNAKTRILFVTNELSAMRTVLTQPKSRSSGLRICLPICSIIRWFRSIGSGMNRSAVSTRNLIPEISSAGLLKTIFKKSSTR